MRRKEKECRTVLPILFAAQLISAGIVDYVMRVVGPIPDTTVIASAIIPSLQVQCGLAPRSGAAEIANPRALRWTDPTDDTKDCEWEDENGVILRQIPVNATNAYRVTIRPRYETGPGPLTATDNVFRRMGRNPNDPLANVRLVK